MRRKNIVLVVAAHPDDEILGCGGTMTKHVDHGDDVHILFLSSGVGARGDDTDESNDERTRRRRAATAAAKTVGAYPPRFADFPDNQMDSVPLLDIVKAIENVVSEIGPGIVFTHHGGDLNIDHRRAYEATLTACRPLPGSPVEQICTYEVLSSTEWGPFAADRMFLPNRFVEVTGQMDRKLSALSAYEEELRPSPHARSIEAVKAQAILRGASVGVPCAEAFATMRSIWNDR
jgi:N-acetylglucosamine malate deacetylase 1